MTKPCQQLAVKPAPDARNPANSWQENWRLAHETLPTVGRETGGLG
ncbi:MAG: hypothetical protein QOE62_1614 [Actinomycetota bacterium]|jgi:hypothetical protein|nr:hypothetical protein [Actinomycetota bacterium]